MAVTIKSPREIELMREAGRILAKTHEELANPWEGEPLPILRLSALTSRYP